MTPANDIEPLARDTTACTEFPAARRRVVHVAPWLAVTLMGLGAGAAGIGLYALIDTLFQFLSGA